MSIFKNLFGKKKNDNPFDFSEIVVDMHSHLVPGIDDGSQSLEESINLIRSLKSLGYKKLITTPHIMADRYKNTPEIIMAGLKKIRQALENQRIPPLNGVVSDRRQKNRIGHTTGGEDFSRGLVPAGS